VNARIAAEARRTSRLAAALLALWSTAAQAEPDNAAWLQLRRPVSLPLPGPRAATADEPDALTVNPAGVGFVGGPAAQYFHVAGTAQHLAGDGLYLAAPIGPLVPALSLEWVRPADGFGSRYRKSILGLAFAPSPTLSVGLAWNRFSSPEPGIDALRSFDVGATWRPWRHLSLGAVVFGLDGRIDGVRQPRRYLLGGAVRWWRDTFTASADLLANDRARNAFSVTHAAFGLSAELQSGLGLSLQAQLPVGQAGSPEGGTRTFMAAVTWNGPHAGFTLGGIAGSGVASAVVLGARLSSETYRGSLPGSPPQVPLLDLAALLRPPVSLLFGPSEPDPYGALLRQLSAIREDPSIPALVVQIDGLPIGGGRAEELRQALASIGAAKPVHALLVGGGMNEYLLATGATRVYMVPGSELYAIGISSSTLFLEQGLAKMGIAFQAVTMGEYKNAPDSLTRHDMSDAERRVTESLLDDRFGRKVKLLAEARHLSEARVRELIDVGLFTAEEAAQVGLVDELVWPDELEARMEGVLGHGVALKRQWEPGPPRTAQVWGKLPEIGVIPIEGVIADGKNRLSPFGVDTIAGAETIRHQLETAALDPDIKAIVLRIDSPGGDATASDGIWRAVVQARKRKPVVAVMGDYAASGGYLAAVGADVVLAQPSTLTGSIGVFALKPDLSGLLSKLEVNDVALQRGANARILSVFKPWTAPERALVEKQVAAFYRSFVGRVADGRGLSADQVGAVAAGRVWTGAQALDQKLVDRIGTFSDAVAIARERAGIAPGADVTLRTYESPRSLLSLLGGGSDERANGSLAHLLAALPELRTAALLTELGAVVALPVSWAEPLAH
jgi:protease-4